MFWSSSKLGENLTECSDATLKIGQDPNSKVLSTAIMLPIAISSNTCHILIQKLTEG
jgi:hypothetical protein